MMNFCHLREIYTTNSGELVRNKVTENIVRPKPMSDMNSRNVEKIVIRLDKRQEILKELGQVL